MSDGSLVFCPLCKGSFPAQGTQHVCVFPGMPGMQGVPSNPLPAPPPPNWQFGPQWSANPFGMPLSPMASSSLLSRRDELALAIMRILIESAVRSGYGVHFNGSWELMAKEAYAGADAMIKESEKPECPTPDPSSADSLIK